MTTMYPLWIGFQNYRLTEWTIPHFKTQVTTACKNQNRLSCAFHHGWCFFELCFTGILFSVKLSVLHKFVFPTIISWVRRDESSLKSFDVQILVLPRANLLVSNGNNIVARKSACFAAIDVNPDNSPLETKPVVRDDIKIWTWKLFNELLSSLTQLITVVFFFF